MEKLKNLGIETVQNLNGVGENLHDHLMLRPIYKINGLKSLNKKINSLFGNLMIGLEYVFCLTVIINHFNLRIYSCIFRLCSLFGQPHKGQLC